MTQTLTPGFVVAHSHRLEDLTAVAVEFIQSYPLGPLEEETVLVQSNGIAQWLKIELAKANGIASMLNVTLPARFVWQAYRAVLGDAIPKTSPFDKNRLSWRIMRILPELLVQHASEFLALTHYLADVAKPTTLNERKLFQLGARIADLFDQYQNYRADWIDHWTQGRDCLSSDAEPVPHDERWQPMLWRALVADIGAHLYWTNRAELHRQFVAKAQLLTAVPPGMPRRLVIFGISSMPQQTLEVLDALKGVTQIVLCVHNPCQHYWANIVDGKEALKDALQHAKRQRLTAKAGMNELLHDDALHLHAHPLLASWGKQGRDYIHLLDLYDETLEKQAAFNTLKFELFDEVPPRNRLQQLHSDVLHLRPLAETRTHWQVDAATHAADRSIEFHICHSIQREVEVLHDQLLAAFSENSQLEPRHIMVMVPDINAYAPHIDAVFRRYDDARSIPYTIADQGQRHVQPMMVALEQWLSIDQARITQAEVLALLGVPAMQQAFNITDEQLVQLRHWLDEAGARWGLSPEHRAQFGMPEDEPVNSWWFALRRMVLGYAMGQPLAADQPRWHNIEPYHEVSGLSADLAGKLGLLIEMLDEWWAFAKSEHLLTDWASAAERLLIRAFKPDTDADLALLDRLSTQLADLLTMVEEGGVSTPLTLATFKESWLSGIDQPNLNQRFLAGSVNFATLMPMRAIPFQHIYVLGMSDEAYPRRQSDIDFDLMRNDYRPGDRSRRDDDRYLFLEALLSAREKFTISWVGRSAQDNSEWPPSVLVAQLRDYLVQGWCPRSMSGKAFLKTLTTEHRLQAFHPDYLTEKNGLMTYATEWQAAQTATLPALESEPLKPWAPQQDQTMQLSVSDLVNFMCEPAQPFFKERLDTYFSTDEIDTQDSETFALNGLSKWQLNQTLIESGVAWMRAQLAAGGMPDMYDLAPLEPVFAGTFQQLQRQGVLGVRAISASIQAKAYDTVSPMLQTLAAELAGWQPAGDELLSFAWAGSLPMHVEHRAMPLFTHASGDLLQLYVTPSKRGFKQRCNAYIRHLLLCAQHAGPVTTLALFRDDKKDPTVHTFADVPAPEARAVLELLLADYAQALSNPSGVVGQLAVEWLDTYWNAISGQHKENNKKVPPMGVAAAKATANAKLLDTLEDDAELIRKHPYATRIALDLSSCIEAAAFWSSVQRIYAPMVRLEQGQNCVPELPSLAFEEEDV